MKYKQICPECYEEFILYSKDDAKRRCPCCNGSEIYGKKLIVIKELNDFSENTEKNEDTMQKNVDEAVTPWKHWNPNIDNELNTENSSITLKYITGNGRIKQEFEISVDKSEVKCLLGRGAKGEEFFQNDIRVSNEHLYVWYKSGEWFIKDDYSKNGTMLNKKLIKPGKEYVIKNGDIIALGKLADSVHLKVIINASS